MAARRRSPWQRPGCPQGIGVCEFTASPSLSSHISVVSTVSPEGMDSRGKEGVPRVKATDTMVRGNGGVPWGYGLKTPVDAWKG